MKKISLEEAYISPYFKKYCKLDKLLEFKILTGDNKDKYNYLLDEDDIRFKQADKNNVTFIISSTVPGSQYLKNFKDAPIFCKLTNDYFKNKVDSYNKKNNTHHTFFAVLPFNNVESAIKELKRINKFNPPINRVLFNGPTIDDKNYNWLESKEWEKLWTFANKNKTIFYIHPSVSLSFSNFLPDKHFNKFNNNYPEIIGSQFGFHINTAIFVLKLYINNVFDKYSNIQWILGHMGEALIWFLWRFDHRTKIYLDEEKIFLKNKNNKKTLSYNKKNPSIKDLYNDGIPDMFPIKNESITFMKFPKKTLTELFSTPNGKKHAQIVCTTSGWFHTPSLKYAIDNIGIENVLFSIDTPYEKFDSAIDWFNKLDLSNDKKNKLGWKNANDIIPIFNLKNNKTKSKKSKNKNKTKKNFK